MPTTDTALYIGEAGNCLQGLALIPGVTIANVPDGEGQASDLWVPIGDAGDVTDASPAGIFDGAAPSSSALATLDGGAP